MRELGCISARKITKYIFCNKRGRAWEQGADTGSFCPYGGLSSVAGSVPAAPQRGVRSGADLCRIRVPDLRRRFLGPDDRIFESGCRKRCPGSSDPPR